MDDRWRNTLGYLASGNDDSFEYYPGPRDINIDIRESKESPLIPEKENNSMIGNVIPEKGPLSKLNIKSDDLKKDTNVPTIQPIKNPAFKKSLTSIIGQKISEKDIEDENACNIR